MAIGDNQDDPDDTGAPNQRLPWGELETRLSVVWLTIRIIGVLTGATVTAAAIYLL